MSKKRLANTSGMYGWGLVLSHLSHWNKGICMSGVSWTFNNAVIQVVYLKWIMGYNVFVNWYKNIKTKGILVSKLYNIPFTCGYLWTQNLLLIREKGRKEWKRKAFVLRIFYPSCTWKLYNCWQVEKKMTMLQFKILIFPRVSKLKKILVKSRFWLLGKCSFLKQQFFPPPLAYS